MDRDHAIRCVMAAVAAGGRTCGNARAAKLLRELHGVEGNTLCVIRDGPIRPIYRDNGCYYIPYRHNWQTKEACAGPWVEIVRKEEQEIAGKRDHSAFPGVSAETGEWKRGVNAV